MDNLISNALKFTHYGGSISIEIKQIQNEELQISIADTGIGIPASLQDDLFKPYTVSGRKGTSNEKSTGLGLSITKEIVELHCGKIWFESKEGKGTTFFIILPGIKSNCLN